MGTVRIYYILDNNGVFVFRFLIKNSRPEPVQPVKPPEPDPCATETVLSALKQKR